jgi:hypothetical protein
MQPSPALKLREQQLELKLVFDRSQANAAK